MIDSSERSTNLRRWPLFAIAIGVTILRLLTSATKFAMTDRSVLTSRKISRIGGVRSVPVTGLGGNVREIFLIVEDVSDLVTS